jgi:protein-S-isoprenylcysteine O-methyltransferase Ste14
MFGWLLTLPPEIAIQWERTGLLLGPAALAGLLVLQMRPTPREASAAMLAFLWQIPSLVALNALAQAAGWWSFPAGGIAVLGLPVDVWIGWAFWWGPCAALLEKRFGIVVTLAGAATFDAAGMPCLDLVRLGPNWLVGEAAFLLAGLLPALLLAHWTRLDRHAVGRTLIHAAGWGAYMLFALPAVALAGEGQDLLAVARMPSGLLGWTGFTSFSLCLLVGLTAALEFARVGHGTPVPLDPPKRVVMSGPYAYVANPMQVTSAMAMGLQALHYRSPGLLLVTAAFLLFDAVYAAHYNKVHIAQAMPQAWASYKAAVKDWHVRWTPNRPGFPALVAGIADPASRGFGPWTVTDACPEPCRRSIQDRTPLVFVCSDTGVREEGVAALSRFLENRNLAWALVAWILRLPSLGICAMPFTPRGTNEIGEG